MSSSSIIKPLDIVEDIGSSMLSASVSSTVDSFNFERMKEAFTHGIVPTVSFPTHAADDLSVNKLMLIGATGILHSSVRMKEFWRDSPMSERHLKRINSS